MYRAQIGEKNRREWSKHRYTNDFRYLEAYQNSSKHTFTRLEYPYIILVLDTQPRDNQSTYLVLQYRETGEINKSHCINIPFTLVHRRIFSVTSCVIEQGLSGASKGATTRIAPDLPSVH